MSKNEPVKEGFYSKIFVSTIVVIWVSLVGGNWLGHYAVEKGLLNKGKDKDKQKSAEYRSMPNQKPKPWVTVDPKQVEAVEQLTGQKNDIPANSPSSSASPDASSTPSEIITSTPIEQATPKASPTPRTTPKVVAASPTPIAMDTPSPTPNEPPQPTPAAGDQKYQLQFGSFSSRENAQRMADELTRVNQPATVEEIDAGHGKVFRVRGGAYSEEEARLQRDKLREQNIDAYIVNQ